MNNRMKYFFPKGKKIVGTRLTPVGIVYRPQLKNRPNGRLVAYYEMLCDCGKKVFVTPYNLGSGRVKSCGCYNRDTRSSRLTTHGLSKTKEYFAAWGAFQRCNNIKNDRHSEYGGRGIRCEFKDVEEMTRWLIKNLPKPKGNFVLDRKDNDGNYSKTNLRWVDPKTSLRNTRRNHTITINGKSKLLCEWAEETGIHAMTIHWRIKHGLPEDLWLFKGKITNAVFWQREYTNK